MAAIQFCDIQAYSMQTYLLTAEEAPKFSYLLFWQSNFKKFGYRDNRNKNRLYFLVTQRCGALKIFVETIKEEAGFRV